MSAKMKEVRDLEYRNKLACFYDAEAGVIEIKLFGCRLMRIKLPPNTMPRFEFSDN